jgi:hypothetical protein
VLALTDLLFLPRLGFGVISLVILLKLAAYWRTSYLSYKDTINYFENFMSGYNVIRSATYHIIKSYKGACKFVEYHLLFSEMDLRRRLLLHNFLNTFSVR